MKRILSAAAITAAIAVGSGVVATHTEAAHQNKAMMSIQLTTPNAPVVVRAKGKIPVDVAIKGVMLDAGHIGKAAVAGHGHYHFYVDCIPADGYAKADIATCYAGAAATTMATFDLSKSAVKISKGTHVLLVALANNNHVLYRAPASAVVFTVK